MVEVSLPLPTISDEFVGTIVVSIAVVFLVLAIGIQILRSGIRLARGAIIAILMVVAATVFAGYLLPPGTVGYIARGAFNAVAHFYGLGDQWNNAGFFGRVFIVGLGTFWGSVYSAMLGGLTLFLTKERKSAAVVITLVVFTAIGLFICGILI
jgi:hypothetical protein